jgi:hypothetical protein
MNKKDYSIYIGADLIGVVRDIKDDMPWRKGTFEATELFMKYRELFERESELSKANKWAEREKVMHAIYELGLKMVSSTNEIYTPSLARPVGANFVSHGFALFHIRGDQAFWRPT